MLLVEEVVVVIAPPGGMEEVVLVDQEVVVVVVIPVKVVVHLINQLTLGQLFTVIAVVVPVSMLGLVEEELAQPVIVVALVV